jgi:hypothetical protein
MARSVDLRVIHCMASETSTDYFAYWNLVSLCDHLVGHCSCCSHPDDFLRCFLESQPILGRDRRILRSYGNVAYFGYCLYCDLHRVTSVVYYEQHLLRRPTDLLFP